MDPRRSSYAGVIGAGAGFVGHHGFSERLVHRRQPGFRRHGRRERQLAFAMAVGTFVFGGAYILLSDPASVARWGRHDALRRDVDPFRLCGGRYGPTSSSSEGEPTRGSCCRALGGLLGVCAGLLALQASIEADEAEGRPEPEPEREHAAAAAE